MPGFYSIRFRLTATFLAIILSVMVIISIFLYSTLERYHINNLLESLERTGVLVSDFLVSHLRGQINAVRLSTLAENMSRQAGARIVFTDRNGVVVGDSVRMGGLLNQRLEHDIVAEALDGIRGHSIAFSERLDHNVMQMAIPVKEEDETVIGVIFLSTSLVEVNQTLRDIRTFLFLATILAMAIVGGGSVALARRFTGPLEDLTAAARNIAEGHFDQHIDVATGDEIGRLAVQFNYMARRLDFYTKNLKKFAGDVAHEVRTPLTTMSLLTKSLKEHDMEPKQRQEFIVDLDGELDRLIALVNDLLELSRLEKDYVNPEEVDLHELLKEIVSENLYRFSRSGLTIEASLEDSAIHVLAVPSQLRQIVTNLLDNALNYTPAGGKVQVFTARDGEAAVTIVEDSGCGIPEEDREYIFERFFRVDRARTRQAGGTGLGLAIVKEIVVRHGGKVWVESSEGQGSRFYFTLPLADEKVVNKT